MEPVMHPAPGGRVVFHVGDRLLLRLEAPPEGGVGMVRTTLGRRDRLLAWDQADERARPRLAAAAWRDVPMQHDGEAWVLDCVLAESGFFLAKTFWRDAEGITHWPQGDDLGITVHPARWRCGNTIYCAFVRQFGAARQVAHTRDELRDGQLAVLDRHGFTVIPPSGTLRQLAACVPHIIDRLGCRILHLLPVCPTPTTRARFGRFGSPYAAQDLTAIDPALVECDQRSTGIEQFRELADTVHGHDGALFLDMALNHTGWGSALQEQHPEWFVRNPDGSFHSPGAWGTTWEDLVELDHRHPELIDILAEALITWCQRGVDGFRCDAGYMIPTPVWQRITARVHALFPETVFLLEGLGGGWQATEDLLTVGGMQWAYSELFQNHSADEVSTYLDHCLDQQSRIGPLIHYSETHDNPRLAERGRTWSLLRNRLCALTSHGGGFGYTAGVEWLATERVEVHQARGLNWGAPNNLVEELAALARLLADHPAFRDDARCHRLSAPGAPVYLMQRQPADDTPPVLVVANTDPEQAHDCHLDDALMAWLGRQPIDLLGQQVPRPTSAGRLRLPAGFCACLAAKAWQAADQGQAYRAARLQLAAAVEILTRRCEGETIGPFAWPQLAALLAADPIAFITAAHHVDPEAIAADPVAALRDSMAADIYPMAIAWTPADANRVVPIPAEHWLVCRDQAPFRLALDDPHQPFNARSLPVDNGHVVFVPPRSGNRSLHLYRIGDRPDSITAIVSFLPRHPALSDSDPAEGRFLLTNGRGAMARIPADLSTVVSKYDAVLAANLNPRWPVDRHVLVKRLRAWLLVDGFNVPLDATSLVDSRAGTVACWHFAAAACDATCVGLSVEACMVPGHNTTLLRFQRDETLLPDTGHIDRVAQVRLIIRCDIEDRSFHDQTRCNPETEAHFAAHISADGDDGFRFHPAPDRQLRVRLRGGRCTLESEWCRDIPHPVEACRGQEPSGDAYSPAWFAIELGPDERATLIMDADDLDDARCDAAWPAQVAIAEQAAARVAARDPMAAALAQAAEAYLVDRDDGKTVIAGYPWFLDWGRDTFICARGLLAGGWHDEVVALLQAFGAYASDGTLPNCIHGSDLGNRDSSDAPLWYALVLEEAAAILGEDLYHLPAGDDNLDGVCQRIAQGYRMGTTNGIGMDGDSGLIWSPAHFTWMDTNHPAGTPRAGYPVEIQSLWLRLIEHRARRDPSGKWDELAQRVSNSFMQYFWDENRGYPADCLHAPGGEPAAAAAIDDALRSNAVFPVTLGLISGPAARATVAAVAAHLVVPGALRSLAPLPLRHPLPIHGPGGRLLADPWNPYCGRYLGDEDTRRKPAYHNGTAWTWTFPGFCEALVTAWDHHPNAIAAARSYLCSSIDLLRHGCRGQLPEILDGDQPHRQRGCDAQAWGVTEALRVWLMLQ